MIIAYASGAVNPTQSQVDYIIDLQGGDTLPANAQLYGGGVDSSNPSASFTFSWSLLRKPAGSTASLSDNALQNPLLGSVDVWGNYLLFLIVTNSATGETSQTDPIKAPPSAFLSVRVQSLELGLEKPSAGERDWASKAHEWVDAIENHEDRIDTLEAGANVTALNDLSDVTLGTLTSGEVLKYNGNNWVNDQAPSSLTIQNEAGSSTSTINLVNQQLVLESDNGSNVITHSTFNGNPKLSIDVASNLTVDTMNVNTDLTVNADNTATDPTIVMKDGTSNVPTLIYDTSATTFKVKRTTAEGFVKLITDADQATTSQYGVVKISPNSTGFNTNSRILDVERLMFTGIVDGMIDYKTGTQHDKSGDNPVQIEAFSSTNVSQHPALVFQNVTGGQLLISDIAVIMASSGISNTTEYSFKFVVYTSLANLASNTIGTSYTLPTFQRISDNKAGACEFNYVTHNASTPLTVNASDYFGILVASSPDYAGNRLQCTMQGFKLI